MKLDAEDVMVGLGVTLMCVALWALGGWPAAVALVGAILVCSGLIMAINRRQAPTAGQQQQRRRA